MSELQRSQVEAAGPRSGCRGARVGGGGRGRVLVRLRPGRRVRGAAAAGQRKAGGSWYGGAVGNCQVEAAEPRPGCRDARVGVGEGGRALVRLRPGGRARCGVRAGGCRHTGRKMKLLVRICRRAERRVGRTCSGAHRGRRPRRWRERLSKSSALDPNLHSGVGGRRGVTSNPARSTASG